MILYLSIIFVAMLLLSAVVACAYGELYFFVFGQTAIVVLCIMLIDALVATVSRLLPKPVARHDRKIFTVSAKEKKFYERLKIRKWKDKVPEIGHFTGFRKTKIEDPKNVEYVERFLLECCYGEIGHVFNGLLGFSVLAFAIKGEMWLAIAIPVAIINLLMNLPSLFILRYTTYKLEILRTSILKKQTKI